MKDFSFLFHVGHCFMLLLDNDRWGEEHEKGFYKPVAGLLGVVGVEKKGKKYRDAIFIVTHENSCPFYTVGDEFKITNCGMTVTSFKPGCLVLAEELFRVVSSRDSLGGFSKFSSQKSKFACGGCEGKIGFEFKKEKDFATLQMKMLDEAEEKRRRAHLDKFFGVLRKLAIFEPLDDDALVDLTLMLDLKTIPVDKIVLKSGEPGQHLYIILQGKVAIIGDSGETIAEMGVGEIFGEMSLLTGDPTRYSVQTSEVTRIAMLSLKNFKQIIVKYPVLQLFLFKLLVERAQTMALRSGNITSGMSGELEEISVVDLFQLINAAGKSGSVSLVFDNGKAAVCFKEGQIVYAKYLNLRGKSAVFAILAKQGGHFSYTKGVPIQLQDQPPIEDFMAILMEGLQRVDERQSRHKRQ